MKSWNLLEWLFFLVFLIWSAAGLTFTVLHVMPATVAGWPLSAGLKEFVAGCLHHGDPVLILLAFANTHLHAARQWSSGVARRWALLMVLCAYGVEWCGSHLGFPFGDYHYTQNFGPTLLGVPLTIPLAWHVVVTNALFIVRAVAPHLARIVEAMVVGVLCTAYDFVLEPFATTAKSYWVWADDGSVPPLNYIAWFVISAVMVRLLAPTLSSRFRFDVRPWVIFALTIAIFVAGRIAVVAH